MTPNKLIQMFIALTSCFIVMPFSMVAQTRQDSIRTFLEDIGETEPHISNILKYSNELSYDSVVSIYIKEQKVLHFDIDQSRLIKTFAGSYVNKSHYFRLSKDFVGKYMENDKKGELLHLLKYLPIDTRIEYSAYYWNHHHLPIALYSHLTYLYQAKYEGGIDNPDSEAKHLFYAMASYVITQGRNYFLFYYYKRLHMKYFYRKKHCGTMIPYDRKWMNHIRKNHGALSNKGSFSYYKAFRSLHFYDNPYEPFCPSEDLRQKVLEILDNGIAAKERECIITKAFALITGTILEQDFEQGKQLLLSIWPQMIDSDFWQILTPSVRTSFKNDIENTSSYSSHSDLLKFRSK